MRHEDFQLRAVILGCILLAAVAWGSAALRRPVHHARGMSYHSSERVGFAWDGDTVVVRVDDREERLRLEAMEKSPLYQEAMRRIPAAERPVVSEVRWGRLVRFVVPVGFFAWWLLFRVWQPVNPYVDGGRAV